MTDLGAKAFNSAPMAAKASGQGTRTYLSLTESQRIGLVRRPTLGCAQLRTAIHWPSSAQLTYARLISDDLLSTVINRTMFSHKPVEPAVNRKRSRPSEAQRKKTS